MAPTSDRQAPAHPASNRPGTLGELRASGWKRRTVKEEMRANLKMGEDDPALRGDLERAQEQFKGMLDAVDDDLRSAWAAWDAALDANDAVSRDQQKQTMLALLVSPVVGFIAAAGLLLLAKALIRNPALYRAPEGKSPPPAWISSSSPHIGYFRRCSTI